MGSRKGLADPATKAWHIWSVERTQRLEDIIYVEEADLFPVDLFKNLIQQSHDCQHIVFGPELLGWPIRRNRTLMWSTNRAKLVWVGPPSSLLQDFAQTFQAALMLDGDIFAGIDSQENIRFQIESLARPRRCYLKPDCDLKSVDVS